MAHVVQFIIVPVYLVLILATPIVPSLNCPSGFSNDGQFCYKSTVDYTQCPFEEDLPYWIYHNSPQLQSSYNLVPTRLDEKNGYFRVADKSTYFDHIIVLSVASRSVNAKIHIQNVYDKKDAYTDLQSLEDIYESSLNNHGNPSGLLQNQSTKLNNNQNPYLNHQNNVQYQNAYLGQHAYPSQQNPYLSQQNQHLLQQNPHSSKQNQCLWYNPSIKTLKTASCDQNKRLCFYDETHTLSLCEAYNKICFENPNQGPSCYCHSKFTNNYYCQQNCDQVNPQGKCSDCDRKFEAYGKPTLNLGFTNDSLFLRISNPLKLKRIPVDPLSRNKQPLPAVCFVETSQTTFNIADQAHSEQLVYELLEFNKTYELYQVKYPSHLTALKFSSGRYWCKGFAYPNLDVISSNYAYYRQKGIDYIFVINITNPNPNHFQDPFESVRGGALLLFNGDAEAIDFPKVDEMTVALAGNFFGPFTTLKDIQNYINDRVNGEIRSKVLNTEFCLPEYSNNLTWDLTPLGQIVPPLEMCQDENNKLITRKCLGDHTHGAYWESISSCCKGSPSDKYSTELVNLLNSNASATVLNEHLYQIVRDLNKGSELSPQHVFLIAAVLRKLSQKEEDYEMHVFVDTISEVMEFDVEVLDAAQKSSNATDIILGSLDEVLESYSKKFMGSSLELYSKNLDLLVVDVKKKNVSGVAFYKDRVVVISGEEDLESDILMYSNMNYNNMNYKNMNYKNMKYKRGRYEKKKDINTDDLQLFVLMPKYVLEQSLEEIARPKKFMKVNFISMAFKKDNLFNNPMGAKNFRTTGWIPNLFTTDFQATLLKEPLKLFIRPYREYRQQHFCSYWKFGQNNDLVSVQGFWAKDHLAYRRGNFLTCEFWHMTHFALLLDLPQENALNLLSLIGSIISFIAIFGVYITAFLSRSWRDNDSSKILLSLCGAIVAQMVLLLLADHVDSYEEEIICVLIGALLHYSIISQFFWMLVIGALQYRKFIIVFTRNTNKLFMISSVVGWGLPIIPTGLTLGVSYSSYIQDEYCYLTGPGLYWGVFLPVSIIILLNVIIFIRIFYEFGLARKLQSHRKEDKQYFLYVKLSIFLFFTLGLTWVFGLLNGFFNTIVLSYMFCICASLQGFVLFWYHVVLSKEGKLAWYRLARRFSFVKINTNTSKDTSSRKIPQKY